MRPPRSTSTAYSKTFACAAVTRGQSIRPTLVLGFAAMRLRTLTGGGVLRPLLRRRNRDERVTVVRPSTDRRGRASPRARSCACASRRSSTSAARRPRPHDPRLPHLDDAAPEHGECRPAAGAAAAELVGLHGDVDAGRATLQAAWPIPPSAVPDVLGAGPDLHLLRDQPGPRLGCRRSPLREPAQRLLAAAARGGLHAAAVRADGAVRAARARLRRDERRLRTTPGSGDLRRGDFDGVAARAASRPSSTRSRSRSSARRRTAARSTSGPSSGRSGARSGRPRSSCSRRPRRRTRPCRTPSGCTGSARCASGSTPGHREAVRALLVDADERVLLVAVPQPGDRRDLVGDARRRRSSRARTTRRRSGASSREELGLHEFEPGPLVWVHERTFPWARGSAPDAQRLPRARGRARAAADDRPRRRGRCRAIAGGRSTSWSGRPSGSRRPTSSSGCVRS